MPVQCQRKIFRHGQRTKHVVAAARRRRRADRNSCLQTQSFFGHTLNCWVAPLVHDSITVCIHHCGAVNGEPTGYREAIQGLLHVFRRNIFGLQDDKNIVVNASDDDIERRFGSLRRGQYRGGDVRRCVRRWASRNPNKGITTDAPNGCRCFDVDGNPSALDGPRHVHLELRFGANIDRRGFKGTRGGGTEQSSYGQWIFNGCT